MVRDNKNRSGVICLVMLGVGQVGHSLCFNYNLYDVRVMTITIDNPPLFHRPNRYSHCCCHFQIAQSQNRVYLNAGTLMLNINEKDYDNFTAGLKK